MPRVAALLPVATLLVATVLSLIAPPIPAARAQDGDPPPRPRRRDDGPRIRLGDVPEEPDAPEEGGERELPKNNEIVALVKQLATWPSADAKQASIRLSAQPSVAYPLLERKLLEADHDWRMICGVSSTLGRIGNLRALELIEAKLQDRKLYQHSGDLLDAIAKIDPVGAKARLLAQLLHPAAAVVGEARERLEKRVAASDLDSLREIYEVGGSAARLHSLELMRKADPQSARTDMARALRDKSPAAAFAAARGLAEDVSEEALELTRRQARSPVDRQTAYGYLSLGLRAAHAGGSVLESSDIRALLGGRGLKHLEPLNRAAAAIVLADAGYYYEIPLLDDALDRAVVPALIDAWVSSEFWNDMKVVQPLALRRLRRLTGQSGLRDAAEWRAWWQQSGDVFVAQRVLVAIPPDAVRSLVLSVSGPEAPGGETTVIAASGKSLGAPLPGELSLLLPPDEALVLVERINASGLLGTREALSESATRRAPLQVAVRAGNRERRLGLPADALAPEAQALLEHVEGLRERHRWQRYRTAGNALDRESFVLAMAPSFGPDRTEEQRGRALAGLIIGAVTEPSAAGRGAEWIVSALEELESIPDIGSLMDDARTDALLQMLGRRKQLDMVAAALLRTLAAARKPEAHPLLMDFLMTRPSIRTHELLEDVLARAAPDDLAEALADEREAVRVAALSALRPGALGGGGIEAARQALGDEVLTVRAEAVRALGRLRAEDVREELTALAKGRGELRVAAIEALGMLGGKASLPTLMGAFSDDSAAVRVTAIEALAASGEPEGLSAIVFAMTGDPSGLVREVASGAIVRLGTRRAADELRKLAIDPAQPSGPRARALAGLASLRGREAASDLERLVEDPAVEVGDEAALALAEWRQPAAVPRLLEMLEGGRSLRRVRQALEAVSLESFGQGNPRILAELYSGWWELTRERGPRGWLADALILEGIDESVLNDWAAGRAGREAVPALLQGLRSEAWYTRRACDLALRDLLGRTIGNQQPWTTPREAERMARAWEQAWTRSLAE